MRWAGSLALLLAALLALPPLAGAATARAAGCAAPVLSLEQMTRQASTALVVTVTSETGDDLKGYTSTLRIEGALKGLPPGPAMKLTGLGYPGGACDGGPRLLSGGLYVVFLAKLDNAPAAQAAYALADGDQSVYTLTSRGTLFPAQTAGAAPQLQPVASADFARDVGDIAETDQSRIEALIAALGLPETVDGLPAPAPAPAKAATSVPPRWLPSRDVVLVIGIAALVLALLVALLWQPREPHWR
jgi:hypothetical protein